MSHPYPRHLTNAPDLLDPLLARITKSPAGAALIDYLAQNNIPIHYSAAIDYGYCEVAWGYDAVIADNAAPRLESTPVRIDISLGRGVSEDQLVSGLLHEGHHARQALANLSAPQMTDRADDHILKTRFIEADAQSFAVLACLELARDYGDTAAFDGIPEDEYGLMKKTAQDCADLTSPQTRRAVFDSFFMLHDELIAIYKRQACETCKHIGPLLEECSSMGIAHARIGEKDLAAIGNLSQDNYLTLAGGKALLDTFYTARRPGVAPEQQAASKTVKQPASRPAG